MSESKPGRIDEIQGEIIHVYDGIEEADNELPLWWLLTFYGAIAFAVFYWIIYHELETAPLPREEYAAALAAGATGGEVSEELLVAMSDDPGAVAQGRGLFEEYCVVCHANQGQGNIGPNLTDPNWIHGGSPTNIHGTIHNGVLQAGMPAWGASLGGQATVNLAAYVLTIQGTNVDGKEPQGEVWVPGSGGGDEDSAPSDDSESGDSEEVPREDLPTDAAPSDVAPIDAASPTDEATDEAPNEDMAPGSDGAAPEAP